MTSEAQMLIDAIVTGETIDAGGMPTTQDVADTVPYAYDRVDEKLRALESDDVIESTTFGNDRVWIVPDDRDDSSDETTAGQAIATSTRGPVERQ